jgi:superfamily II DNA/RNA helicase
LVNLTFAKIKANNIDLITQLGYFVSEEKKGPLLRYLIMKNDIKQVLVFTSSVYKADHVADKLRKNGMDATAIHSKKSQEARTEALSRFKKGTLRVLVTTDLLARGIDIKFLPYVINYELPRSPKDYIHRIGRTGRADKEGIAISYVSDLDVYLYAKIETTINSTISDTTIPEEVEITPTLLEFEKPEVPGVNYLAKATLKNSQGAFHEKKEKNKKKNLGSKWKREQMKNKGKKKKR